MKPLILLISTLASTAGAATLEDQVKANKTVEQLYREAVQDITENVLLKYRDSLEIDEPTLEVVSSTSKTVDIKVTYTWRVPESVLEEMRDTLGKYFLTTLYESKITVGTYNCNGHMGSDYCNIRDKLGRFLESKSVGTEVSLLGVKDIFSYNSRGIEYQQSRRYSSVFTVDKSKVKGDPKPSFASHVYNISGCTPFIPECNIKGVYRK
ncbi:hypothetical protein HND72_17140 [Pseudomonas putida]|uniref:Uncharacterized protein n=1 Tax=Pseudomonas taiwanensis SJ9 TaxID=1388762 RepID=V7DA92_9PSED|nr:MULTISPECIES: hypothetical protein [Pseudomonas]ESW39214.1 hypothetical protein O164_13365 [Pseudomonas taiwanensis SJ9]MDO1496282.1 hypothetical protein [Pseudomonas putida]